MSDFVFLNKHRVRTGPFASDDSYGFTGAFEFSLMQELRPIRVIASDREGWKHVSVSHPKAIERPPSWYVMCAVKDLFWDDEDTVIQFHPKKSEYVNNHSGCLHLWQCMDGREQPTPPPILVGIL